MISSILRVLSLRLPVPGGVEMQDFRLEDVLGLTSSSKTVWAGKKNRNLRQSLFLPSVIHGFIQKYTSNVLISEPGDENMKGWGSLRKKGT